MYAKEELKLMQEKEDEHLRAIEQLKLDAGEVLDNYYKEACGDNYDEIKNTLQDIRNSFAKDEKSYKNLNKELHKIITKGTNNIISKKKKLGIKFEKGYRKGDLVLSKYGFGLERESYWGTARAERIDELDELIYAFSICKPNTHKKIWKGSHKKLFKILQKNISDWKIIPSLDKSISLKQIIYIKDDNSIFKLKKSHEETFDINISSRYNSRIGLGKYYNMIEVLDLRNNNPISNYSCFIVWQVWDKVKKDLKDTLDKINEARDNNKKIMENIVKEARPLLAVLDL